MSSAAAGQPADSLSAASALAAEVKGRMLAGDRDGARGVFGALVADQQRRAVRIAFQYLRDAHDADEAVQDAFVKTFTHITTYREDLPFEVWFTRILVNRCLDIRKARARRLRWAVPLTADSGIAAVADQPSPDPTAEDQLLARQQAREIAAAVDTLPERQRTVFLLSHMGEQSASEIGETLGVTEATVRVHLFRAVRKLRKLLER